MDRGEATDVIYPEFNQPFDIHFHNSFISKIRKGGPDKSTVICIDKPLEKVLKEQLVMTHYQTRRLYQLGSPGVCPMFDTILYFP